MACRSMLRCSAVLVEPFRPPCFNTFSDYKLRTIIKLRQFHSATRPLRCSHSESPSSSSSHDDQGPPQEAVLKAISACHSKKECPCQSKKGMPFDRILRSSSRYKKAKLTASQFEESESEPVDFVPDSQAAS